MQITLSGIRRLADGSNPESFSNRMRTRRFKLFDSLAASLPRPLRILDVGGTNEFWEKRGWADRDDVCIHTLNLIAEEQKYRNIYPCSGDATNLSTFAEHSFDIAFSNSVIEHLFTLENQKHMASEVRRVGKAYWVQTPNYWFPMEPHFHIPGWQWMPLGMRVAMLRRWRCGWRGPCPDRVRAKELASEVRLLTRSELSAMFPGGRLVPEKFGPLTKSWMVIAGFPSAGSGPLPEIGNE
jgi:hypothetical protein